MRSLPNIFKSFLRPVAADYVLPNADDILLEEAKESSKPQEEGQDSALKTEEEKTTEQGEEQQVIRFAQVQAEEILNNAKQQAEEWIASRQAEAEEEVKQQKEQARGEGFRQGYGEGLEKARIESQRQLAEQLEEQARQVQDFLEKATEAREEMLRQTQGELKDLSIAVAEKVIHISLKSSVEVIARMIQAATEKLKRREWVHIYLADSDARTITQAAPELITALAGLSDHIKFVPMADDEAGTCIIEMPDEIIDASAATQLSNIRELLRDE